MREYRLEELFDLQMGKTPARKNSEYWNDGTNDWISIRDLSNSSMYITLTKEKLSDIAIEQSKIKLIPENTVIMSFKLSIGKVAITPRPMFSNEAIMAFHDRKIEKISPEYLYYLFLGKNWSDGSNKAVMGITLNKATLSKVKIKLHDFVEQQNIVNILDKCSKLIVLKKQELEELDNLIKSRFIEVFGDPVINPMGWELPMIEEVVANEKHALKAGPFGSALKKEFYVEEGYKIYGQEQVISGDATFGNYYVSEEKYNELKNCSIKSNDVLISLVGTYGKLLIVPEIHEAGIINPRLMKITFDEDKINTIYFKHFFQSEELRRTLAANAHGGTMPILNLGIVRKIKIPMPPLKLQKEYESFINHVDKLKVEVQKSLDETQVLFDSLMQEYFE